MTRFLITTMMTLTLAVGGLALDTTPAQACDSCAAHKKAKGKQACAKCKKAGKTSCECGKKKSDVEADALKCGKGCSCDKCKKGCDCGKKDCAKCKKDGKKSCGCK